MGMEVWCHHSQKYCTSNTNKVLVTDTYLIGGNGYSYRIVKISISYTPERVWYPCYYTETEAQGYHTSEWGITCLSPTKTDHTSYLSLSVRFPCRHLYGTFHV